MIGVQVWVLALLALRAARAQDANCDFYQFVQPGQEYYVFSPGYPALYKGGVQCRWQAYCSAGYKLKLDLSEINIPKSQSQSCTLDRLLISRSGDPQLSSAEVYCGQGALYNVSSTAQRLSVGLVTSSYSSGGRFYGKLVAWPDSSAYPPTYCNCGYKNVNRIVGGEPTQSNEFPMMAGIVYAEQSLIRCGATIITDQHVVTAAHCVVSRSTSNTAVVTGEHDVTTGSDSSATQAYRIQRITIHPQYTSTNYVNDIAVVKIVGTIIFSESVGPVCLPFNMASDSFAGSKVEMLGWGSLYIGGPTSNVLRKVTVDVISNQQCQAAVPGVGSGQLCTYTPGKDACQDDSGGPLLYKHSGTGRLMQMGIVSFGKSCASGYPGVNTRITSYLDFIQHYAPYNYCRL